MIYEKRKTNEISITIALVFCVEALSGRHQKVSIPKRCKAVLLSLAAEVEF